MASASTQETGKITATNRGMDRSGRGGNGYESGISRLASAYDQVREREATCTGDDGHDGDPDDEDSR